jgi:predicted aspartyl protease
MSPELLFLAALALFLAGVGHVRANDALLQSSIGAMRAGRIKALLTASGVSVRGIVEKSDLVRLLFDLETEALSRRRFSSVSLFDVTLDSGIPKKYSGIDLELGGRRVKFIIDTGSSMNLIKAQTARTLGLSSQSQQTFSTGFGGGGQLSSTKVRITDAVLGRRPVSFDAVEIEDHGVLPFAADGLLGLPFLAALGAVEFDFESAAFKWAVSSKDLLTPLQREDMQVVDTKIAPSGLLLCEASMDNAACVAMLDLGSAYTIANSLAVTAAGGSLANLATSPVVCAGIDGRPLPMRIRPGSSIRLGAPLSSSPAKLLDVYAADVPGLAGVGLGAVPTLIVGVDVLRSRRLVLDMPGSQIALC